MAIKIVFNQAALDALDEMAQESLLERAEAIAAACNAESTWGGYQAAMGTKGHTAQVWSADGRNDEARDQRLLKNLDAGA